MHRSSQEGVPEAFASGPRLATALVLVIGLGALLVTGLASLTAGTPADPGIVATDRTAVIAVSALGLAMAARYERLREFGWLLYPVLLIGAVKLLVEDFQRSRPATLFIALALYGAALVAAPRVAKRAAGAAPSPPVN